MAKRVYIGVSGKASKIKKIYVGVGGVARKIKHGYIGVAGVAKKFFSAITSPLYIYNAGTWSSELDKTGIKSGTGTVQSGYLQQSSSTWIVLNCTIDVTDYSKCSIKLANMAANESHCQLRLYNTSGTQLAALDVSAGKATTTSYWTANFDIKNVTGKVTFQIRAYQKLSTGSSYGSSRFQQIYLTE